MYAKHPEIAKRWEKHTPDDAKLPEKKEASALLIAVLRKNAAERGLWDNVHAKRRRGEAPAKPGDKDYPDSKSFEKSQK